MNSEWDVRLSEEELVKFFNKYDIIELNSFIPMFKYIYTFDMNGIIEAYQKVYKSKSDNVNQDDLLVFSNISSIGSKNSVLTDRELDFLSSLVNSAVACLSTIEKTDVRKERSQVFRLSEYIEYELEQRRTKRKPKLGITDIKIYKKEA
mgnify:CR=1 FL=1